MMVFPSFHAHKLMTLRTDRLPASIVTHDHGQGRVKLNDLDMLVIEGTYTSDGKLVERRPMSELVSQDTRDRDGLTCRGATLLVGRGKIYE